MIDICMTAWPTRLDRVLHFSMTLDALRQNLSGADFRLYCSVETEPPPSGKLLASEFESVAHDFAVELSWRDAPANLGANMNAALRMGESDLILMVQDDWELSEPLDLRDSITFLANHDSFVAIRYQHGREMRIVAHLDGFQVVQMRQMWPFLDSPRIQRRTMMDKYGEYVEGIGHLAAEHRYGRNLAMKGAKIAAYPFSVFQHLGLKRARCPNSVPTAS